MPVKHAFGLRWLVGRYCARKGGWRLGRCAELGISGAVQACVWRRRAARMSFTVSPGCTGPRTLRWVVYGRDEAW